MKELKRALIIPSFGITALPGARTYFRKAYNDQYPGPYTVTDGRIGGATGNPVHNTYMDKDYDLTGIVFSGDVNLYLVDIYGNETNYGTLPAGKAFQGYTYDFFITLPAGGSGTTRNVQAILMNSNDSVLPNQIIRSHPEVVGWPVSDLPPYQKSPNETV